MSSGPRFQRLNFMLSNALRLEHLSYFGASHRNQKQFSAQTTLKHFHTTNAVTEIGVNISVDNLLEYRP